MASVDEYKNEYECNYIGECLPLITNECATLISIEDHQDTSYVVAWDWNDIANIMHPCGFDKVIFGDCSSTSCPRNHTLFELDIIIGKNIEQGAGGFKYLKPPAPSMRARM